MKKILACALVFLSLFTVFIFFNRPVAKPLSVVIIGGGPSGLATAIEAHQRGAEVTLIEKREAYSRLQGLFLIDSSLQLLKKWGVNVDQMYVIDLENDFKAGFVPIKNLEEALEKRVRELGIRQISGAFEDFHGEKGKITIAKGGEQILLSYDILVGADGAHSQVRERLGISLNRKGMATGAVALIHADEPLDAGISEAVETPDFFTRKMTFLTSSLVFIQSRSPENTSISQQALEEAIRLSGWEREAELIAQECAISRRGIPIRLQQVEAFADEKKGVILVGDAAAEASFFEGMGANTAFKTAAIAGDFFEKLSKRDPKAYPTFHQKMKETTDELIENSRYLFNA